MNRLSCSPVWKEATPSWETVWKSKTKSSEVCNAGLSDLPMGGASSLRDRNELGVSAPYAFFLPHRYEANYRYPLIVWLHNDGFNERQINHVLPHVSTQNFVGVGVRAVRAADAAGHRFEWSMGSAGIASAHERIVIAIDEACRRYSIHSERVILAGYRDGGEMALRIAMRDPGRFAAVVSMGGGLPAAGCIFNNLDDLRRRRLPMLWQWGVEGEHFQQESLKRDIRTALMIRSQVEIRQYVDDDEMTVVALRDMNSYIIHRVVLGTEIPEEKATTLQNRVSWN